MKKLLFLKNKLIARILLFLTIISYSCFSQENPKTSSATKSATFKSEATETDARKSDQKKDRKRKCWKKNKGSEIKNQSPDEKTLDSLKKAKDRTKGIK